MLALDPGALALMDDGHLLAALESESSLMRTPVELELMRRLDAANCSAVDKSMIEARASEALAQFPTEDCLEKILDHPDCGEALGKIVMEVEAELLQSAELGISELNELLDAIGE